jgi:hypothetical protein
MISLRRIRAHPASGHGDDRAALNESEGTEAKPGLAPADQLEDRLRGLERLGERGLDDEEHAPLRRALLDQLW